MPYDQRKSVWIWFKKNESVQLCVGSHNFPIFALKKKLNIETSPADCEDKLRNIISENQRNLREKK